MLNFNNVQEMRRFAEDNLENVLLTDITMARNIAIQKRDMYQYILLDELKCKKLLITNPEYMEDIVIIPTSIMDVITRDLEEGVIVTAIQPEEYQGLKEYTSTIKRYKAEYSPQYVQLVSQFLIYNEDRTKLFLAVKNGGGEERLKGKLGMIGGHIGDILNPMEELWEETNLKEEDINNLQLIPNKIIVTTTPNPSLMDVSREHLGLIIEVEVNIDRCLISEDEEGISSGKWFDIDELRRGNEYKKNSWLESVINIL